MLTLVYWLALGVQTEVYPTFSLRNEHWTEKNPTVIVLRKVLHNQDKIYTSRHKTG